MKDNQVFKHDLLMRMISELGTEYVNTKKIDCILDDIFSKYDVYKISTDLSVSDISDKVVMFLQSRRLEGKSEKTIKNYFYLLRKFSSFSNKQIKDITLNDLRAFIVQESVNVKQSTANTKIECIQNFFSWLTEEEIIDKNPSKKLPNLKIPRRLRQSLTLEELERIRLACSTNRERAIIEFLIGTGCRVSEIIDVNIEHLDMNNNTIRVIGKGDSEREIFFNEKTRLHINNYINERRDNNNALFVSERKPYKRLGSRAIEKIVNKIGVKAGFSKSIFPHLFRHSFATIGLKNGASMTTIQNVLGHSSVSTTERYAETNLENVKYEYNHHMIQ